MFDWVISNYPLPEPFKGVNQTKDIEFDYGGTMSLYWISPDGFIWVGNYTGTHTFEIIEEGDPEYNDKFLWCNHRWIPTGEHGKWRVHPITKYVEIYPAEWSGERTQWPRLKLHFKNGKLQDFMEMTVR